MNKIQLVLHIFLPNAQNIKLYFELIDKGMANKAV